MKKHRPRVKKLRKRQTKEWSPKGGWYHGGAPLLKAGDMLLPRSVTGAAGFSTVSESIRYLLAPEILEDEDWVFVTSNVKLAFSYCSDHPSGNGWLYRVQPEGKIERDPDRLHDCFRCERARIIDVVRLPFRVKQQIRAEIRAGTAY